MGTYGAVFGARKRIEADRFAETVRPAFIAARDAGCTSLREYAAHLSATNAATPNCGRWYASNVSLFFCRLGLRTSVDTIISTQRRDRTICRHDESDLRG